MRLNIPQIPARWQDAHAHHRDRLERQFAILAAWAMLATLLAYQFSHALRGVPMADASGLDLLLRAPAYAAALVTLAGHYTGRPRWSAKAFLRLMSLSLMFTVLSLFLLYYQQAQAGLQQISKGLMVAFFGVTLMTTRGLRDWLLQFLLPLLLFVAAAGVLAIPLTELGPYLFGPGVVLVVGLLVSEALRGLSVQQFLSEQALKEMATTDQLTGLLNRHAFLPLIRQEIHQAERNGQHRFSVILGDLDHFKRVNDRFGHETGDRVLQETATRIRACLRRGDALCRWGGEELLILLPGTGVRGAREVGRKILAALADQPMPMKDTRQQQTISLGIAGYRGDTSPEALIGRADRALYRAKSQGRNQLAVALAAPAGGDAG